MSQKKDEKVPDFTEDINGKSIHFDGNSNLKPVRCTLALTKDHIEEYIKCAADIFYFAENYYYILSLDHGIQKIKMRDYQRKLVQNFMDNRFNIVLAARQIGKSTSFELFVCWYILFHADKNVALLANKAANSHDLLRKVKNAYELLPKWMQQGVKRWNNGSIALENGCQVFAAASSSSSIRSKSINVLIIDECSFKTTFINIRNKKTGLVERITGEELEERLRSEKEARELSNLPGM